MEKITKRYFYRSKRVENICAEAKQIYMEVFTNNNKQKAKRELFKLTTTKKSSYIDMFISGAFTAASCLLAFETNYSDMQESSIKFVFALLALSYATYLFSMCLIVWQRYFINYRFIFDLNVIKHANIGSYLLLISTFMLVHTFFPYCVLKYNLPISLKYIILVDFLILVNPLNFFRRSCRYYFIRVIGQIICSAFHPIAFRHFYMADCLLSLTSCYKIIYKYSFGGASEYEMIAISALFPLFRIIQCIRRFLDNKSSYLQLLNCGKYITSLLFISACFLHNEKDNSITKLAKICVGLISTGCSLYWDLFFDWGIRREQKTYPIAFYIAIILFNSLFRFSWILPVFFTRFSTLFYENTFCILEITRRFLWSVIRLEYEHINNCSGFKALSTVDISLADLFYKSNADDKNEMSELGDFKKCDETQVDEKNQDNSVIIDVKNNINIFDEHAEK
ncbi:hypothetical protein EDEG_02871 [Edhazardia aedis USNM 41457]|uniref:EXS domain-containing protein n=1 Tax=Edhazardia aedis (strain USNM 41457) TaxID=1003232 RepID=J9DMZ8_EDHAE|nr:hypothetical protein EDEG_02871 [Edhazardia aedis USNM 41457]|eukprot:EJW02732.1 hypothetical protein EDEG_02871 [Edhazardia aedis USNM 41457]